MPDLKQFVRRKTKRLIRATFERLGYELVRTSERAYGWERFFSVIKCHGFAPKHIVDVGANKGHWTRTAIQYFPDAQYTLVEPQDYLKAHVQDLIDCGHKIRWINAGAGDKPNRLAFTIGHRDDSASFTLSAQQAEKLGFQQTAVEVKTLNEIIASSDAPPPEMVKIDAEGFDLKVLSGAGDLYGKTDIFLVEANLAGGWDNSLLAVVEKLACSGYRPVDITDLNRSPKCGVLWLIEIAFLRDGCRLFDGLEYE
jgi:FkbM family methyltransferase